MKKIRALLGGILIMAINYGFSQSEVKTFTYENYNSKSLEFIEYAKNPNGFVDLKIWYEGKVSDELMEKLMNLSQFIQTYSEGMKINIVPYSQIPKKNNPLVIYYLLVDKEEKNEFGLFLGYLDDGNILIDNIKTLKWRDKEEKPKTNMDSTAIPPPPPPPVIKNK